MVLLLFSLSTCLSIIIINVLAEIDQNSDFASESQEPRFIIPAVLKCDPEEKLKPQQLDTHTLMIIFMCRFVSFGVFCAEILHT